MNQKLEGVIRHIISMIAGVLITIGVLNPDLVTDAQEALSVLVGSVFAIVAFVRSWITKKDPPVIP